MCFRDRMTPSSFEIKECVVLVGTELEPRACRRFAIENGCIAAMETGPAMKALERPAPVIIPGLINSHTHMGDSFVPDGATGLTLEQGFFRPDGYKYRQFDTVDPEDHFAAIRDALGTMASSGTVAHLDFREQGLEGTRLLRKASEATGVESVILGQIGEIPFSKEELAANNQPLPESAAKAFKAMLAEADGVSESTMNDLTDPAWRELVAFTGTDKLRAIHCLESETYRNESFAITGRGDLARALDVYKPHLIVHLTVANAEEIALLAASGVPGVLNPRANAALGLPLPPVRDLLEAGIPLLLGTDNGLLNSPNMLAELDFTYRLAKSQYGNAVDPDPARILAMATSNIRHLLPPPHYGYLEEGLPATFCVIDGSAPHLRRSRHLLASLLCRVTPADVLATFREGIPLHQQGPTFP